MTDNTYAYVGIKDCGCIVAAAVDVKAHSKDVAKSVADFIKDGLKVERVTVEEAREKLRRCKH